MRLEGRRSGNVVDVRGRGGMPLVGGGIGMVVLVLVALFLGVDPSALLQTQTEPAPAPQAGAADAPKDQLSAQRMTWFRRGFEAGRLEACDTFAGDAGGRVADTP